MGLVHNHELGTAVREVLGALRLLDEIGRHDGKRVALKDRLVDVQVAFQTLDGARQDQLRLDVELLRQLPLPLLGQGRGAEHRQAAYLAPVKQLAGDETGLDRLADAYVVGDQHAHRIELQRHHQRHQLIGPGLHGDSAEAAKRPGAAARVESRAASRSRRPEVKSPRSSRLGSRNVADSTGSTAGSTPVISSSRPPTGRSISSSSVESGSTTHSRPRARTRVPDSERFVGLTFQVSAHPVETLTIVDDQFCTMIRPSAPA